MRNLFIHSFHLVAVVTVFLLPNDLWADELKQPTQSELQETQPDDAINKGDVRQPIDDQREQEGTSKQPTPESVASAEEKAPEPKEKPGINIWEYEVSGNSLLSSDEIEATVRPFLGPERSIEDIQIAANALEKKYVDKGYHHVLVTVPEQSVIGGLVKLEVIEGRLGRVRYTNSKYNRLTVLKGKFASVEENTTINIKAFQEDMSRVNSENSAVSVVPIFRPGKEMGLVDLDLKVSDKLPIQTSLELNNHSSGSTSPLRLDGKVTYSNLWQANHSFSLQAQISPENRNEVEVFSSTYILPYFDTANRIAIYGVSSDSKVSSVTGIDVIGIGEIYGSRFVAPLNSTPDWIHSLSLGLDYKDFEQDIVLVGADRIATPIDYMLMGATYNATQKQGNTTYRYSLGWNFGVRGLFNNEREFAIKRFKARPNFNVLKGSVLRLANLENGWRLKGNVDFQLADTPLISNEQLSAGGAKSVRGYYESQALGDDGVILSLEAITPNLVEPTLAVNRVKASSYFDWGTLFVKHTLPDQDDNFTLFSWGVGMRATLVKELKIAADLAVPLVKVGDVEVGDYQFHVSFKWQR